MVMYLGIQKPEFISSISINNSVRILSISYRRRSGARALRVKGEETHSVVFSHAKAELGSVDRNPSLQRSRQPLELRKNPGRSGAVHHRVGSGPEEEVSRLLIQKVAGP